MSKGRRGRKSIVRQVVDVCKARAAFGESKYKSKYNNTHLGKIYSRSSFEAVMDKGIRFAKWCRDNYGTKNLQQITTEMHLGFLKQMHKENKSPYTLKSYYAAINKLSECTKIARNINKWHGFNVTKQQYSKELPRRKVSRMVQLRPATTPQQSQAILDNIKNEKTRDTLDLQRLTGARVSELVELTPTNFNFSDKTILVEYRKTIHEVPPGHMYMTEAKNGQFRSFKIPSWDKKRVVELVCKYPEGFNAKENTLKVTMQRAAKKAGVYRKGMNTHALRKEWANRFYKSRYKELLEKYQTTGTVSKTWGKLFDTKGDTYDLTGLSKGDILRRIDHETRIELSEALGHHREDVTYIYVSK